jgi:probable HAF family extracellular repeat protein
MVVCVYAKAVEAQTFQGLGVVDGATSSYAADISGDGLAVTGFLYISRTQGDHAFLWTREGGMLDLGVLGSGIYASGHAVSSNGPAVTGSSRIMPIGIETHAFLWTPSRGMQDLGTLHGHLRAEGHAISADGSVVAGASDFGYSEPYGSAFIWTAEQGMESIGVLPGDTYSGALGISADGSIIAGYSVAAGINVFRAIRWTAKDGMVALNPPPQVVDSYAYNISDDGTAITGAIRISNGHDHAFVWTASSGMQDLGVLPGGTLAGGQDVASGGQIVVGRSEIAPLEFRAVMWVNGEPHDLNYLLPALGLDLRGWTLTSVDGISSDGSTLVGIGTHEYATGQFRAEAWIATIPSLVCTADIVLNGEVDVDDLLAVINTWGPCIDCSADIVPLGGNGLVDVDDLLGVINSWGDCK